MLRFVVERVEDPHFPWIAMQIENKALFAIDHVEHLNEAKAWCGENIPASNWRAFDSEYCIFFRREIDAFTFKIRWG
ncbi:MAG: hypothetical protein EOP83_01895 [Verrucomicrobiaceae bacterium]|nr:MAG: hypothetical protein EOP83_01895 [Verrucomicrobiaceae bacterium]